jgi:ribosomal protein S18 acetylase RimI-like enzyme
MIELQPVSPANAMTMKSVRLRALKDSPTAFASKYEKESTLTNAEWVHRAGIWGSGDKSMAYLALDGDDACGIAAGYYPDDGSGPYLVSMWVAPSHRRRAVGQQLVEAIIAWARSRGARQLLLDVTTNNEPAIRFYKKLGFTRTGKVQPYPNDPALQEYEMSKSLV